MYDHHRPDGRSKSSCTYRVLSDVLKARDDLNWNDKGVLMTLSQFGRGKPFCIVGNGRIAKEAGLSVRTVTRSLAKLSKVGLIRVEEDRTNKTGRRVNKLWMDDPALHPHQVKKPETARTNSPTACTPNSPGATPDWPGPCTPDWPTREPIREPLKRTKKTMKTTRSSSSSSHGVPHGGRGEGLEPEPAEGPDMSGVFDEDDNITEFGRDSITVSLKASHLFGDDIGVDIRADKLHRAYGKKIALHALDVAGEKAGQGRAVRWQYVLGVAENMRREGGEIGAATIKPAGPPRFFRRDPNDPNGVPFIIQEHEVTEADRIFMRERAEKR